MSMVHTSQMSPYTIVPFQRRNRYCSRSVPRCQLVLVAWTTVIRVHVSQILRSVSWSSDLSSAMMYCLVRHVSSAAVIYWVWILQWPVQRRLPFPCPYPSAGRSQSSDLPDLEFGRDC